LRLAFRYRRGGGLGRWQIPKNSCRVEFLQAFKKRKKSYNYMEYPEIYGEIEILNSLIIHE
jgi:hypothetical protein